MFLGLNTTQRSLFCRGSLPFYLTPLKFPYFPIFRPCTATSLPSPSLSPKVCLRTYAWRKGRAADWVSKHVASAPLLAPGLTRCTAAVVTRCPRHAALFTRGPEPSLQTRGTCLGPQSAALPQHRSFPARPPHPAALGENLYKLPFTMRRTAAETTRGIEANQNVARESRDQCGGAQRGAGRVVGCSARSA